MGDTSNRNNLRRLAATVATLISATASTFSSGSVSEQLPSCTVTASQPSAFAGVDVVYLNVDSHGNFYNTTDNLLFVTPLSQFNVPVWRTERTSVPQFEYRYYQTSALEATVCSSGKKIAFIEDSTSSYGSAFPGVLPKPYILIRELATTVRDASGTPDRPGRTLEAHLLLAVASETNAVTNGAVGGRWVHTSNSFRVPRVGSDLVPVYRFFGGAPGRPPTHFYTADPAEIAAGRPASEPNTRFVNEGIAFYAKRRDVLNLGFEGCTGTDVVFVRRMHFSSPSPSEPARYRYVSDTALVEAMKARGWVDQGTSFCALSE